MKNIIIFCLSALTFIVFSTKVTKAEGLSTSLNTTNYIGFINKKLNVVLSLTQSGNKLSGYYYYDKIGVNIKLTGEVIGESIKLTEINEQGKNVAKFSLTPKGENLIGTWQSFNSNQVLVVQLQQTEKQIPQLPTQILGDYNYKNESGCKITISITKSNKGYHFYYQTAKRQLKGSVTFSRDLGTEQVYINLHGIEWAEDSGDVTKDDDINEDRALPTVVQGLLDSKEIVIQNTGNAMNYYVKLNDCDEKFIHLKKWKKPN
ncbi:MAG: hypothetical protein EOO96_00450 [Pedobacter sp.]|nr:MAG: hypothetical protein EOO96_00450 [Pedobacter sp.]